MMRAIRQKFRRLGRFVACERGTQMVELAIVLPVLLLMLGATAEFGRFFYTYTTLTKATRAGARFLTVAPGNGSQDGEAKNLVVYGNTEGDGSAVVSGLTDTHIIISREGPNASIGMPERVTVRVEGYTYEPLLNLGGLAKRSGFSLEIDVDPSTTMRCFYTNPS